MNEKSCNKHLVINPDLYPPYHTHLQNDFFHNVRTVKNNKQFVLFPCFTQPVVDFNSCSCGVGVSVCDGCCDLLQEVG